MVRRPLLLLALVLFPTSLPAQLLGGAWETQWQADGACASDYLGSSIANAGDLDGDGVDDIIVGAKHAGQCRGVPYGGSAYAYSGISGQLRWQFDGLTATGNFGTSVSGAGDVDGDGVDDVIIGAPQADGNLAYHSGSAFIYSGATGVLLWRFDGTASNQQFGQSVSSAGDINNDGFADVLVGAPTISAGGIWSSGSAMVYSGFDGSVLLEFDGQQVGEKLGQSVAGVADVNGDGVEDFVIGSPYADSSGRVDCGTASVFSGATGALLWQFHGQGDSDLLGSAVSGAGDVDGDGREDILIGALVADPGGLIDAGSAFLCSGTTGNIIWRFDGLSPGEKLGFSVAGGQDIDGDGTPDSLIGAPIAVNGGGVTGAARLYSGATGALLHEFVGPNTGESLGSAVAMGGDFDQDGIPEMLAGSSNASPNGLFWAGSAYAFKLAPYLYLSGDEISVAAGAPVALDLQFPPSEATKPYLILASLSGTGPSTALGLDIPLATDRLFQRMATGQAPAVMQGFSGRLDNSGMAVATMASAPALSAGIGRTLFLAAITLDLSPPIGRQSSIVRYLAIVP